MLKLQSSIVLQEASKLIQRMCIVDSSLEGVWQRNVIPNTLIAHLWHSKMGSLAIILLNEDLIDLGCTK